MNTTRITDSLNQLFHEQDQRIVFWHDPEQEFVDVVPGLELGHVDKINLKNSSQLEIKVRIELGDQGRKYLLYAPYAPPEPDQDWLLDIRMYSYMFSADRPSMILGDLGLANQSMHQHLGRRRKFFDNKDRFARLKKLVTPDDRERELDIKMLAVLTKADQASIFDILMNLFGEMYQGRESDCRGEPGSWQEIQKFGLDEFFWEEMVRTFGYRSDKPGLYDLLIRLLVTDLAAGLHRELPDSLKHFILEEQGLAANVSVFASQWRSHLGHFRSYGQASAWVATDLNLDSQLGKFDLPDLVDIMTFEQVEQSLIRLLRTKMVSHAECSIDELKSIIARRKDGHWAKVSLDQYSSKGNIYFSAYTALEAALDLTALRREYDPGFSYGSADDMFHAYTGELYRFDQLYRTFHEAADEVELAGWDVLKPVQEEVEACYCGWYLDQISLCWGSFMDGEKGLLNKWFVSKVRVQHQFFSGIVSPLLKTPRRKVFVIISDALRFEAAEELVRDMNTKSRFKAGLDSMLGVLPGYTALGMAALLPRKDYGYREDTDQVLVDGRPCASLEQRNEILSEYEGIAVRAEDLLTMNKDQGREFIRPWRVIYIYHNQIDATGDNAASEKKTFAAVRQTIDELSSLIKFIINSLNGSNVLVTADHGFLYQDSALTSLDKSVNFKKPDTAIKARKRYIIGRNLGRSDAAWKGSTARTAGTSDDMEFWVPKGMSRFHFSGGARFTHGGAMPQEIILPVIRVRELDTKAAEKDAVKRVGVSVLGSNRRIVNTIHKVEMIQTDKVSERVLARSLAVSVRDGSELMSSEQTVTFDSVSDSMEDRKRVVKLLLKKGGYDSTREYSLVLRDPETGIEYERIPVYIDLAFIDDF
ncbi:BREX-1 system phosphatase PglZ type A [Desulfonatronovibrio magnus]|uniref:BREX-1 system phosphatase PglZ type A n=1 Tax=Desulfonatronovibrio magnus TaxID=698827 RepID=UPI0005EAD944|nr:BREX-1 system phosphatase PglZ type A [Desulfonatronovibrio magnus]